MTDAIAQGSPQGSAQANASSERLERALIAYLRQELSAPAVTMAGFLDIIIEDARRLRLDQALPDLERMRIASTELNALVNRVIEAPAAMRGTDEHFDDFQGRLRHDLRTPLNAIKGYGEILIDDAADAATGQLVPDLERVRSAANDLLAQIDAMVEHTREWSGPRPEQRLQVQLVADLLKAVTPVDGAAVPDYRALGSRILVVDDIASNRDLLTRRLVRDGHQVETAADGPGALDRLVTERFDLILLDLMMPGMSGFEVLCRLKSSSQTRHIPVIMISALEEIDTAVRCIEAGAEDYLPKPFNPIVLRARINACLEKKWLRDREQSHLEEIRLEKQRSESLLLNILPQTIVTRMRNGEAMIADRFDEATILFADLVGFTVLATGLPPNRVLEILSEMFSRFDRAVAERGLEKIKTIGDAYLVAGGLPEPMLDHASRIADLSLAMVEIVRNAREVLKIDLRARIGIHTGPVVAGVIGTHKFIYDVWGDTVNTASRMETFGAPDRIHVSAELRAALGQRYVFEHRGPLEVKGKGIMETYFLVAARS
jgi:class 3 adenylate cyclase/CheY-like chemotaxis protein